jgi:NAD(P)-dependent dehydrogenase (short-subunit alcohol dehydrogenase family)
VNRLRDLVTVITGAGSGIGRAAAEAFVAEGAMVGLLDRDADAIGGLAQALGPAAFVLPTEVGDEAGVRSAFEAVRRRHGRLDVLYNCAGIQLHGQDSRAHELPLEVWNRTLTVNLTGMFLCCKYGIALMLEGAQGSVINCASPTGLTGCGAGYTAYSSSKGGIFALTRVLAIDYARDGIRVNSIVPGTTQTPLIETLLADPETKSSLEAGTPLGRLGTPQDLTGIAVFLASDESRFATGATFVVDGGVTIR